MTNGIIFALLQLIPVEAGDVFPLSGPEPGADDSAMNAHEEYGGGE